MTDKEILNAHGWDIDCQSPFEISTKDGSFASQEAAYIILDYFRPKDNNPRRILERLDVDDYRYIEKLNILHTLITRPLGSFIIPKEMHEWCEDVGFKTTYNTEDSCGWWSVSLE